MFNKKDFLVFNQDPVKKESSTPELPDLGLSYEYNTWNGYFSAKNNREDDEFSSYLKDISRGR